MLCFLTEENKNFILIIFSPFLSLFFCLMHIHGQYHKLAIQDVLANSAAISSQTSDILPVTCLAIHPLLCYSPHIQDSGSSHCSLWIPCTLLKNKCKFIKVIILKYASIQCTCIIFAFPALFLAGLSVKSESAPHVQKVNALQVQMGKEVVE